MRKHVLLAVSGGIAAYKSCDIVRRLQDAGCEVRVCMTPDACEFVSPITFEALSHYPVLTDLFDFPESPNPHIMLGAWADVCLVCPATADIMAKIASGIADECVSTTILALQAPALLAPAMNVHMWKDEATQANVALLQKRGYGFIMPSSGLLACGDVGEGKLAAVSDIVADVLSHLKVVRDLAGLRLLVNAGPTHEAIDAVRYIANASSGKMGFSIAQAALDRGAAVTLVAGPCALATPEGAERIDVISARAMHEACMSAFEHADAAICSAAVADYTPRVTADRKLKKSDEPIVSIELVPTKDILADLCRVKDRRVVCGFAAETDDLIENAIAKLTRKHADMIVANDVSRPDSTFGSDTDRVSFVTAGGVEKLPTLPKAEVANAILDRVARLVAERR
ncbi:bifunctional phosphopantothenoylcysteine decarboxylase/phosphopantothenate--cysteine ligase CoaBC [Coriobacteriales bacterium OH1046]|nr:bifunctional phosphopantothenoylcysteine decarboxylase/phosphopantothenate--cysteine ligase CoaBC [Coriobacteriales bacterium OH1046]